MTIRKQIEREVEFKLSISRASEFRTFLTVLKQMGIKIGKAKHLFITDYYLDSSPHPHIPKKRFRIRHVKNQWQLTAKSFSKLKHGFVNRTEETRPLRHASSLKDALAQSALYFGNQSILVVLFTIRNYRSTYLLRLKPNLWVEASFDQLTISRGKKSVQMKEIELEMIRGELSRFKNLLEQITRLSKLTPSARSKVATALKIFKL